MPGTSGSSMLPALLVLILTLLCVVSGADPAPRLSHPRLYFTPQELTHLRSLRTRGIHARIWKNLTESADWCLTRTPRTAWIAPVTPDPVYENLYDRFYAMMHDMAVMEHLAFAYAYSGDTRYLEGARQWALACGRVWRREADGEPDASKAYAVMRLLKGLAVSYDILYNQLADAERQEIRQTLVEVGDKYYQWYLKNPGMGAEGQGFHHASVETSSFGVAALALLGEVPEASDWLALMVKKHTDWLLPHALTPSGAQTEGRTFWASTMQYRLFFLDALRRVTGRDLFREYAKYLDGRMALACVAGPKKPGHDEDYQTILFEPSYGQLNYWSPALFCLAREYRRPIYQHFALWDGTAGAIQKTRYITPHGEPLLFTMGGYAYAWCDESIPARIETGLPLSLEFPEVNEVYARASFKEGAIVAGMRRGMVQVHAGGRPVLIDEYGVFKEPQPVKEVVLRDDGAKAVLTCQGVADSIFAEQTLELKRPGTLTLRRKTEKETRFWFHGAPKQEGDTLLWPDGTRLRVVTGSLVSVDPKGHHDAKSVGNGLLKLADPMPRDYPLATVRPDNGVLVLEIQTK